MLCRTLQGHGHWVNTMALSTDYVMRTGAFDPAKATLVPVDQELSSMLSNNGNNGFTLKDKM